MEQVKFFNKTQKLVFDEFAKNENLKNRFYFTGGTALSIFHLQHRESKDLDFFSEQDFNNELVTPFMQSIAKKLDIPVRFTQRDNARFFEFVKNNKLLLKVDFVHYPHKRLDKSKSFQGIQIDSLQDIATNKLLTINQRLDVKDYVDLYFLLKDFTLWDLIYGVEAKFNIELDLILISGDFMQVKQFDFLPKMLVPLKLDELKSFFISKSEQLAKRFTK